MATEFKPLKDKYNTVVAPELKKELNIANVMAIPQIEKIVLNVGLGRAKDDSTIIPEVQESIALIAGQRPVVTNAKEAISNFKIREGMPIGLKVTLRGDRMWFFLDKLINIALPRTKDFRGISSRSFDGRGNYSLGIQDQSIFPEIDTSKNIRLYSLQLSIITTAGNDDNARLLLSKLGMPFKK